MQKLEYEVYYPQIVDKLTCCLPGIPMYTKEFGKVTFAYCEICGFGGVHIINVEDKDGNIREYHPDGRYKPSHKTIHIFTEDRRPLTELFIPEMYKRKIWFYQSSTKLTNKILKTDPKWANIGLKVISSVKNIPIDNFRYKRLNQKWFNIIEIENYQDARNYIYLRKEGNKGTVLDDNLIPERIWNKYYKGFKQYSFELFK